jgi:hypothetical protein
MRQSEAAQIRADFEKKRQEELAQLAALKARSFFLPHGHHDLRVRAQSFSLYWSLLLQYF